MQQTDCHGPLFLIPHAIALSQIPLCTYSLFWRQQLFHMCWLNNKRNQCQIIETPRFSLSLKDQKAGSILDERSSQKCVSLCGVPPSTGTKSSTQVIGRSTTTLCAVGTECQETFVSCQGCEKASKCAAFRARWTVSNAGALYRICIGGFCYPK